MPEQINFIRLLHLSMKEGDDIYQVRCVQNGKTRWFSARDTLEAFGYSTKYFDILSGLPDKHKCKLRIHDEGPQNMLFIDITGVYSFAFRRETLRKSCVDAEKAVDIMNGELPPVSDNTLRKTIAWHINRHLVSLIKNSDGLDLEEVTSLYEKQSNLIRDALYAVRKNL